MSKIDSIEYPAVGMIIKENDYRQSTKSREIYAIIDSAVLTRKVGDSNGRVSTISFKSLKQGRYRLLSIIV